MLYKNATLAASEILDTIHYNAALTSAIVKYVTSALALVGTLARLLACVLTLVVCTSSMYG